MTQKRGFTLVELIITMTIIVILMALAVINLRSSQSNARDAQRSGDAVIIARGLENRYNQGFTAPSGGWLTTAPTGMTDYPSSEEVMYALGGTPSSPITPSQFPGGKDSANFSPSHPVASFITEDLPSTSNDSFAPPSSGSFQVISAAGNAEQYVYGTSGNPQTITSVDGVAIGSNYLYEPITSSNQVCTVTGYDCVRYNLYYISENNGTQIIRSKHQ